LFQTTPSALSFTEFHTWKREAGVGDIMAKFSSDGGRIAFQTIADHDVSIWVKQTSGGDPLRISPPTEDWQNPIWSPDGQSGWTKHRIYFRP
jgi:Tol biopolymer transport system component